MKNYKHKLKHLGLLAIGVIVLFFVVEHVGIADVIPAMKQMSFLFVGIVILTELVLILIGNWKWHFIISRFAKIKYTALLPIFMSGLAVNNLTPGPRIGGEPVRAHYLAKRTRIAGSEALGTATLDVISYISVFSVFALIAMVFVLMNTGFEMFRYILGGILALSFGVLIWMAKAIYSRGKDKPRKRTKWFKRKFYNTRFTNFITKKFATYDEFDEYLRLHITKFKETLGLFWNDKKALSIALIMATGMHVLNYFKNYLIFIGLGQQISILHVFVVVTVSIIIGIFVWVPGGTGVVEATMIALYTAFGVSMPVAAAATLISRALFYFTSYILGYISLCYLSAKHGKTAHSIKYS